MRHHGDLLPGVIRSESRCSGGESHQSFLGILGPALLDQPVGRFRRKGDTDNDRKRPDPLNGKRNAVSPLGVVTDQSSQNTRSDDLTNDPAQVDVGGEVLSEVDRHDVGSVGHRHRLESTPGELEIQEIVSFCPMRQGMNLHRARGNQRGAFEC